MKRSESPQETERRILREVEKEVPYNNVSELFCLQGERPDPRYGGTCLVSAMEIQRRLQTEGIQATLHNGRCIDFGGHVVVVSTTENGRSLLDAAYVFEEPLSIDTMTRTGESSVRLLPIPADAKSRTMTLRGNEDTAQLSMRASNGQSIVTHDICLRSTIELPHPPPSLHPVFTRRKRTRLMLATVMSDLQPHLITVDIPSGEMRAGPVTEGGSRISNNDNSSWFLSNVDTIAKHIGVTRDDLLAFMLRGFEIYKDLHPDRERPSRRLRTRSTSQSTGTPAP